MADQSNVQSIIAQAPSTTVSPVKSPDHTIQSPVVKLGQVDVSPVIEPAI